MDRGQGCHDIPARPARRVGCAHQDLAASPIKVGKRQSLGNHTQPCSKAASAFQRCGVVCFLLAEGCLLGTAGPLTQ